MNNCPTWRHYGGENRGQSCRSYMFAIKKNDSIKIFFNIQLVMLSLQVLIKAGNDQGHNALPDDDILEPPKLKSFADDKFSTI